MEKLSPDLGTAVASLSYAVDNGVADEVSPYDLAPAEFRLLRVCMEKGECIATELAEILFIDPSRISRIVTKLVDMGLLRRRRLRSDRRIVMLRLTEKGNELTVQLAQSVQIYDTKLTEGISEKEMCVFRSVVSKILSNHAVLAEQSQ